MAEPAPLRNRYMSLSSHHSTHAVVFHHFHDDKHPAGQGAINEEDLELMLDWLGDRYSLLSADEYQYKCENQRLSDDDICLSFDDALLCQYEIAYPIIRKRNLSAFFFVYSSPIRGEVNYLEIFRYFRTTCYENIEGFYDDFLSSLEIFFPGTSKKAQEIYDAETYLKGSPFYTETDKWFRFLRDDILGEENYRTIMLALLQKKNFDIKANMLNLWMNEEQIRDIHRNGNIIGLHSWSHPTNMKKLAFRMQEEEYRKNGDHLSDLIGQKITSMSHPCGSYNDDTLKILNSLGIKIGFRSNMATRSMNSSLEIPRENHANIYRELKG